MTAIPATEGDHMQMLNSLKFLTTSSEFLLLRSTFSKDSEIEPCPWFVIMEICTSQTCLPVSAEFASENTDLKGVERYENEQLGQ